MGLAQSALILLGIGIISEKFGAGVGLGELGTGIKTLAGAPLGGVGAGLFEFSGGLRAFGEALGDIGRGFGELFENIPEFGRKGFPPQQPSIPGIGEIPGVPTQGLIQVSGGDQAGLLPGGGGSVPTNGPVLTLGTDIGQITGTYSQIFSFYETRGFAHEAVHSLVDPQFNTVKAGNLV